MGEGAGATTTSYVYDVRDRLVEVQQSSSILSRFAYDFEGRRSRKIGSEGVRQYVYDDTSLYLEYDDASASVAKYDYGSDRLISLSRRDEPRRYFHLDGLRSVTSLTSDDGSTAASYHLDAWGNYRFPTELTASRNRFGFTGHLFDKETGLYNAKARYFDPQLGRFLTQDSYLGEIDNPPSLHRYFYVNANPTRFVDPTGHAGSDAQARFHRRAPDERGRLSVPERAFWDSVRDLGPNLLRLAEERAVGALKAFARAQIFEQGTPQQVVAESFKLRADSEKTVVGLQEFGRYEARTLLDPIHAAGVATEAAVELGPAETQRHILGAAATTGELLVAADGVVSAVRGALPAAAPSAARHLRLPAPDQAKLDAMLARLPRRVAGEKTSGTIEMNTGGQVELKSGVQGPGELMPEGFGFIRRMGTATHVEGHGAAAMRLSGASEANLYINNIPCPGPTGCSSLLPQMLPSGATMSIYGPSGYVRTFTGLPDPRPFPMRVTPWVPNTEGSFLIDNPTPRAQH
ncbi:MAG: RHS repeat-associated core domain-containing protein [Vicinamibacteria bacterium]